MTRWALLLVCLSLGSCGGDPRADSGCNGNCAATATGLAITEVETVIAQAVQEAQARNAAATIAVVDRVGNVLAVFRMNGAASAITIDSGRGVSGGLEGITIIPDSLVAIAKAISGAYLSSEGNAFSTRTASQIIQQFFNPGERDQPGGPLFGVQFSQLPCSDLAQRYGGAAAGPGPHRSPLGLSADPGGFPLYKDGSLVGGIGVIADGRYGIDLDISDRDQDLDELIALAGQRDFAPPLDRLASRITVDGKTLRYSDARTGELRSALPAPAFSAINGSAGSLQAVTGYSAAIVQAGTRFGLAESGVRPATGTLASVGADVLVDAADVNRYPPRDATDAAVTGGARLRAGEVESLLRHALLVAARARAQIRRPLGTPARVSVAVVDTYGAALGIARARDAPVFGTDVALQKARTASFNSNSAAAADLLATPDAVYAGSGASSSIADYVARLRSFIGVPTALADGALAFTDRAGGNLSRPYFPDGVSGGDNGPLSKPIRQWSPFSTGLQLDLVNNAIIQHVVYVAGSGADVGVGACTQLPATPSTTSRIANGVQIFPGSVPIYRGQQLVGGLGVSGDGVDQDDMIAFLGVHEAGLELGTLGNAPPAMRADTLAPQGVHLRYVQCPQAPYVNSDAQNVCEGK